MARATNSAIMRQKNEKMILSLINDAPISRAGIAKKIGLTKAAVTIIIDELKERNVLIEEKAYVGTVGRNPIMLYINGDSFYSVGINISRLRITVGVNDLCGKNLAEKSFDINDPDTSVKLISKAVGEMIEENKIDTSKIFKTAIAAPGPVDTENGVILNPPNFDKWHNYPIAKKIEKELGYDTVLTNCSFATTLAERYFGIAKEAGDFMSIRMGEGIGFGIFAGGKLFKGPCELGHVSIRYDGEKCECGNRGCLEKYALISNLLKGSKYKSWKELADADDDELIEREADYLSTAVITANNIFDLDMIVLCGDLTYRPEKLIKYISEKIKGNLLLKKDFALCPGKVMSESLVASSLAVHHFYT
ncbi:MAG: ROK family transcriptional regulator [Ruminococcaceae bacterium]|nr:ROK family transcriptional regulator [Oscillospiraceae bacterium]